MKTVLTIYDLYAIELTCEKKFERYGNKQSYSYKWFIV